MKQPKFSIGEEVQWVQYPYMEDECHEIKYTSLYKVLKVQDSTCPKTYSDIFVYTLCPIIDGLSCNREIIVSEIFLYTFNKEKKCNKEPKYKVGDRFEVYPEIIGVITRVVNAESGQYELKMMSADSNEYYLYLNDHELDRNFIEEPEEPRIKDLKTGDKILFNGELRVVDRMEPPEDDITMSVIEEAMGNLADDCSGSVLNRNTKDWYTLHDLSDFSVGDKVEIVSVQTREDYTSAIGKTGVVVEIGVIDGEREPILLSLDQEVNEGEPGWDWLCWPHNLKIIEKAMGEIPNKLSDFSVGDEVQVCGIDEEETNTDLIGCKGVVIKVEPSYYLGDMKTLVEVKKRDGGEISWWFASENIKVIEQAVKGPKSAVGAPVSAFPRESCIGRLNETEKIEEIIINKLHDHHFVELLDERIRAVLKEVVGGI